MKRLLLLSSILIICRLLTAQSNFIKQDTVFAKASDCTGGVNICIDSITYNNIGDYTFVLDGQPFTTTFDFCKESTLHTYFYNSIFQGGYTGPFRLNSWSVDGVTYSIANFTSLNQLLDSMRIWDPTGGWQLEAPAQLILGYPQIGETYSCQSITGSSPTPTDICYNEATVFNGLKFKVSPGFHQFIVIDTVLGKRDTVTLGAACVQTDTVRQTMEVSTNRAYCMNTTQLLGQPQLATFTNFCSKITTHVTFDSLFNFCAGYTARTAGIDTACLRVCDQFGMCDTTYLYITAEINPFRNHVVTDTISIGLSRQKCNITIPPDTIKTYKNLCPTLSGTQISFVLDTAANCVTYSGLAVGTDTACIQVCNTAGLCDTTFFYIQAQNAILRGGSFIITDTVFVDSIKTKCLAVPAGTIDVFNNICATNSSTSAQFSLDNLSKCVSYRGLIAGTDTACIKVCNSLGTCDTTTFIITIKRNSIVIPPGGKFTETDTITLGLSRDKCDFMAPMGATIFENICAGNSGNNIQFNINSTTKCVTYTSKTVGIDTACIRICNALGTCDTTTFYVRAKMPLGTVPKASIDTIDLSLFQKKTYCPDSLELEGSPLSLIKFCKPPIFNNVDIKLDTIKKCAVITGKSAGVDTFCIAICNLSGSCDTTTLYVRVSPDTLKPTQSSETLTLKVGEIKTYCPDSTELASGIISNVRSCTITNVDNSTLTLNNVLKCVELKGLSVGRDTVCVVLCNSVGLCDTTTLYLRVTSDTLKPTPTLETIDVKLDENFVFTDIDTSEILGAVDTIFDACPGLNGSHALMVLNRAARKVQITGLTIGKDKMCVVVCNRTSGLCDTTTLVVNVVDTIGVLDLMANTDFDTVGRGKFVDLLVYENDSLVNRIPTSLVVTRPPIFGKADTISYREGKIRYTAGSSPYSCGIDSFRYRFCVDTFCAEATVIIEIVCPDSLKFYNAISPNKDAHNDAFMIDGLQKYPNNTLMIFNRWGMEVLKSKNYENDWQGTWNGKDLPDGTYFYYLRNDDTGEVIQTGYLQILR